MVIYLQHFHIVLCFINNFFLYNWVFVCTYDQDWGIFFVYAEP